MAIFSALQRQWEDLTDTESSTYYSTSSMDSEMSRILEYESKRHQGTRVTGRKGVAPHRNTVSQSESKNGKVPENSRTSLMNIHPQSSSKRYPHDKTRIVKSTLVKKFPHKSNNSANAQCLNAANREPSSVEPSSRGTSPKHTTKIGQNSGSFAVKTVDTNIKLLKGDPNKKLNLERLNLLQCTSAASQMSLSTSTEANRPAKKGKCPKPLSPPPLPPPRVDSMTAINVKSPERMLSL